MKLILAALAVLLIASNVNGDVVTGTASSGDGFLFLGKFCIDFNPHGNGTNADASGLINLELTTSAAAPPKSLRVYLYSDEDYSWPAVYGNPGWTCAEKIARAKPNSDSVTFSDGKFVLRDHYIHQGVRPRFWFVVLANCQDEANRGFSGVDYNLHMVQNRDEAWSKEFGVNVRGLNTLYVVFFVIFTLLVFLHIFSVVKLYKKLQFMHPLVRLFLLILFLEYTSIILNLVHFGSFTNNGYGAKALFRVAELLEIIARICFMLLLCLLAKGWTISGDSLRGKWAIIIVIVTFTFSQIGVIVWKFAVENPAETGVPTGLQVMQSIVTAVWLSFAIWFTVSIFAAWRREDNPVKKGLYGRLGLLYAPWFTGLPAIVFGAFVLSPWVREKSVTMLQLGVTTIAYFIMAFLTWHSRAAEYFDISTPDVHRGGLDTYDQL